MPWSIVVIDDSVDFRLIVRALIRPMADTMAVVEEAADGEAGLALARRVRPDLVITELKLPRLDGAALTQRLRAELPGTRVILMSSFTEDAHRLMASSSGADACVHKGVITTALLPAIRDVMRRGPSSGGGGELRCVLLVSLLL